MSGETFSGPIFGGNSGGRGNINYIYNYTPCRKYGFIYLKFIELELIDMDLLGLFSQTETVTPSSIRAM